MLWFSKRLIFCLNNSVFPSAQYCAREYTNTNNNNFITGSVKKFKIQFPIFIEIFKIKKHLIAKRILNKSSKNDCVYAILTSKDQLFQKRI